MDTAYATRFLGQTVTVTMDRPMGARHPEYGYVYPVNYGEVEGTRAPDGDAVDAYVLGVEGPRDSFTGTCIAIIRRRDDADDKLVVVPEGVTMTDEQILAEVEFQERFFDSVLVRERDGRS